LADGNVGSVCIGEKWIIVSRSGRCEDYEETARELTKRGVSIVRIYEHRDGLRIEAR